MQQILLSPFTSTVLPLERHSPKPKMCNAKVDKSTAVCRGSFHPWLEGNLINGVNPNSFSSEHLPITWTRNSLSG